MSAGKDARRMVEAKSCWLTGTAAGNFVAISQAILGVKPGYDGLAIDPCIPSDWDEYTVTRVFRGVTYVIHVVNPSHVQKGVKSILVNQAMISGNVLPLFDAGTTQEVLVTLG